MGNKVNCPVKNLDYYEYVKFLENLWKSSLLHYSDKELFRIFPEAKEIIQLKIKDYQEKRLLIKNIIKSFRKKVDKLANLGRLDNFSYWFWYYAIPKYFLANKIVEIDKHLKRLLYQQQLISSKSNLKPSQIDWTELKQRAKNIPLEEIALPHLEKVKRIGNRIVACCPFHDDEHPSFNIYLNTNSYFCFSCNSSGDSISFKMKIDGLSFREAIRSLAYD